jgi:hypothetical protein
VNLGGLDLVDGAVYEWVLDAVTPANGIEGYGVVRTGQPGYGNATFMNYDLVRGGLDSFSNDANISLAFELTFSDGGVANPNLVSLGTLPQTALPSTPLPAALPLFATGLGGLGLLGWCRKRKAQAVA